MTTDQPVLPSDDEEIDLREVFAALQRRWGWAFGCGFWVWRWRLDLLHVDHTQLR